jgi:hypothetical protein
MIDESMKFAKQSPVQSYTHKKLSGRLLDQAYISTEQLVALLVARTGHFLADCS